MSHVYIAHSARDLDALLALHEALRAAGIPDWYTPDETGDRSAANQAIDDAFACIVLVSADAVRSKSVRQDVERAKARGLKLIPYQIDKARLGGFFKTEILPHLKYSTSQPGAMDLLVADVQAAYKRKCPVVAVMNLKGGVGKTTISAQLSGAWQSALGGRILLVDLDPQYNLTQTFFEMEQADASAASDRSVISLFERSRLHVRDAVSPAESWSSLNVEPFSPAPRQDFMHDLMVGGPGGRLDLISGQFEISKYAFATDPVRLTEIKRTFLRLIDLYRADYDLVVIDTNPNATFLTRCVLEAADHVLVPMHADTYSLRGVRLLNQVIQDQIEVAKRPVINVLFNAVGRSEQSAFEADARNGVHDGAAGFALSKALLRSALPKSQHLSVRGAKPGDLPWKQLVIHSGRGGGLKAIRESLIAVAMELRERVTG